MDAVEKAKSGHPGMPMGMADIATILYKNHLKFNPNDPEWIDRDRLIISNGHGSMLLYSCLYLTGYKDIDINQIKNFRQLHNKTAGHPEYGSAEGIETTTGPLSQGLANAVGMALAEKKLSNNYGKELFDHYTYVFAGDGCLMEGLSHEACSLAGHLKLNKLIMFFDNNSISIDGSTDLSVSDNVKKRFEAYNWNIIEIDGHKYEEIDQAIIQAKKNDAPTIISCKTKIGFGSPNKEGSASSHGSPLGEDEISLTRKKLEWNYSPFEIPDDLLRDWRSFYKRNEESRNSWLSKNKELFIVGMHIAEYENRGYDDVASIRNRKLLLHKRELSKLKSKIDEKGVTMVPLSLYLKKNLIKMEFGLAKGKKLWDKRKDKQDKDAKRKIDRKMKEYKNK